MWRKLSRHVLTLAVLSIILPAVGAADGIIIPWPYRQPSPPWPHPETRPESYSLDIKYHHVETVIEGQVGTTHVDEVFENPYSFDLEGTYIFPLPKGAAVDRFSLKVDGKPVEGEMLDAAEAAVEYRSLVNKNRDPALLEYIGRGAVKARIYPIPAQGEKRVEITYSELLPYDGGLVKFVYPLDTERFSRQPIEDVDVRVDIKTEGAVESVFSPSHKVKLERKTANTASVRYHVENVKPSQDFVLYYAPGDAEVGASVLAHREGGEDGYLLLVLTPPAAAESSPEPKEVIFVVDVSGSMAGDKIEQVREAASYCLNRLGPGDRFNIIPFNEQPTLFRDETVPATKDNVNAGLAFVKELTAGGGTNIDGALGKGLASASAEAVGPTMVVFLTDGKPTVGERNVPDIVANARAANENANARIFSFGVGYKVRTELLDDLSRKNGGTTQYVEPGEDLELAVTSFYDKISRPVLTDVELAWENVECYDAYPPALPDIFAGTQLTLFGRFKGELADGALTLSGERAGRRESFRYELATVAGESRDNPYIAALWATRKIGFLLEQIKLEGEDKELVDSIVALSKRYGIPTPYTSYLVEDAGTSISRPSPTVWGNVGAMTSEDAGAAGRWMAGAELVRTPGIVYAEPQSRDELSVRESKTIGGFKEAAVAGSAYGDGDGARFVAGKSFRRAGGLWRDIALDEGPEADTVVVEFASDEYFKLIEKHPDLAPYFALGAEIEVLREGVIYKVTL
jgi:Ca-activated chloride channel family protein